MARTVVTDKLLQDNLEFQGTESIKVPAGTTAQRGTPSGAGELRYNTQLGTFEGYDGSNWGPIGAGVIDTDEDTYITAEATTDKDSLDFWTAGTERMNINSTGAVTISGDLIVNGTTTTLNSTNIEITESIIFEGSTADDFETTFNVVDPTADRTITLPDATGTISVAAFTGDAGSGGTIGLVPAPAAGDTAASKFLKADSSWQTVTMPGVFTGDSGSGGTTGLVPAPAAGDAAASKFLKADGNWTIVDTSAGQQIGTPTDTTFNEGAYYQASTAFQSGSVISGISTSGTVADALDGVNETIRNIHNNTYVQGAYFTRSPIEGGASPGTPLVVRFTILAPGDATHMDLEFDNTTQSTSYTSVTNDTTWKDAGGSGVHYYDYSFTDVAGGLVDVTMTLKCQSASGTTGLTEGSYFKYKFTAAVNLWEPDPAVLWTTTSGDQIVDLGSGTAADREIEFDTTTTLYAHYWMIEFGDGTKYPTSANTGGDNAHVQSNWIDWSTTKKYTYDYDANGSTVTADVRWSPKVWCRSITARGNAGFTNSLEKANHIEGFITPVATLTADNLTTGNNDESGDTNAQSTTNTAEGHPVKFTNTSANLGTWGDTTYTWDWGDLTSNTVVTGGDNVDGDVSNDIEHYFTLANDDVAETFDVTLKAQNNRQSNNNHTTSATTITVNIDPRAVFSGAITNQNTSASGNPSYVNSRIGYNFTKYDPSSGGADSSGASNIVDFTNSSGGITGTSPTYAWTFNNGQTSTLSDPPNQTFTTAQAYNIQLITQNTNSYAGGTDDTELKSNYITINATPSTPPGLTGLTIAVPSSTGSSPLACADTTDNTAGSGSAPTGGASVTRIVTTTMSSNALSGWANEFPSNGTYAGVLTAHLNEGGATGTITFDGSNKVGTNGILEVTQERDSNARDNNTYPDNFFKEFKAKVNLTGLSAGFNTAQLKHDDGTNTAMTEFVYDDMTSSPTVAGWGNSITGTETIRYMSGVKFYNTGSTISIIGQTIDDLTGQTYRDTTTPLTISNDTGTPISTQTYTYATILPGIAISGSIPKINVGVSAAVTLNGLTVNINGSGQGKNGIIRSSAKNVNGTSSNLADTAKLMWWIASPTLDELNLPNNITNGSSGQAGKRIKYAWTGTDYAYPAYTPGSNDWYTTYAWNSQTDTLMNTNEAGCYLNEIKHTLENFSTGYLPVGNDLGTGRSSGATQYFTLAFKRNSIAKFSIKITGEVTSLYIAFPQYGTDNSSSINGWLDCSTLYAGAGFPGANTGASPNAGNGSNGVRRTGSSAQQGTFAVNTALTNAYANLDLGEANTGLMTYPTVLVRFGVANGKSVTAISLEDWNPA